MARERMPKIDCDATAEQHFQQLESQGQVYLAQAAKQQLPSLTRQRILSAALKYLESRTRHTASSQRRSQPLSQALTAAARPTSAFQTLLSSLIDNDIDPHALIEASARAADSQLAPVLIKCLFVLSKIGPITDHKVFHVIREQTQVEEEDIFGDQENGDPQKPSQLGSNKIAVRRTGQSFVDDFVSQLADTPTSTQGRSSAVFVASIAREAPLSDSASQNVLLLLMQRMSSVQLFELPAFLYQLLLLASTRGTPAAKGRVLLHIAEVFSHRDAAVRKADALSQSMLADDEDAILPESQGAGLRQVQGTALLHIEYALKHDPSLSSEIIKLAKAGVETPRHLFTSFGIGIILSLSRAASVQTDVMSMMREVMLRFDREHERRSVNLYSARVSMNDDDLVNVRKALLTIAESSSEVGWDYVKESLLRFSFILLDKPLASLGLRDGSGPLENSLVFRLYSAHPSLREGILEQLTTRIALQEKSACQSISIIALLSAKIPIFVLEHSRYVRDGIELLVTLPPWMAGALMDAYKPLLLARPDLQDYFQLVIRKSLFHRDTSNRAVAIKGFLTATALCGSNGTDANENENTTQSKNSERLYETQNGELMETIQPLRRVFSYSAPLRAYWYISCVSKFRRVGSNTRHQAAPSVMRQLLKAHFHNFIDGAEAPYVLVEHCVDERAGGKLVEPLGDLIWSLAAIDVSFSPSSFSKSFIIDLAKKVAGVSHHDFAFVKGPMRVASGTENNDGDFDNTFRRDEGAVARANRNKVRTLGSVAEALVNSVLMIPSETQQWQDYANVVVPLLSLKEKMLNVLREAGVATASDAFNDLGGDMGIEKMRPGMKMLLQRGLKSGGTFKKGNARKKKGGNPSDGQGSAQLHIPKHRFGVFNVLISSSSCPRLPLSVIVNILELMVAATSTSQTDNSNIFFSHEKTRDFQEVKLYLLTTAQKHVEEYVLSSTKASAEEPIGNEQDRCDVVSASNRLAGVVMDDVRRSRNAGPDEVDSQSEVLKALQILESCGSALRTLTDKRKEMTLCFCGELLRGFDRVRLGDGEIFESAIESLEYLISELLDKKHLKEGLMALQVCSGLVENITPMFACVDMQSTFLDKRISWAVDALAERSLNDSAVVKSLVRTCLYYTENNNDLRRAEQLSERLLIVLGDCDENAEQRMPPEGVEFKLCHATAIKQNTSLVIVDAILDVIDRAVVDVEWCLSRMTTLEVASSGGTANEKESSHLETKLKHYESSICEDVARQAIRAEDAAQIRLEGILRTLRGLARCAIGKWTQQERLIRLVTKTYKQLSSATQAQVKRKGDPRTSFVCLINESKKLAPILWDYLAFIGAEAVEERRGKGASKAAREARVMPQLVYEVEKFEKVLIGAQKRTKISLLRGMRRNVARDFRIREDRLHDDHGSNQESTQNYSGYADANVGGKGQTAVERKRRRIG